MSEQQFSMDDLKKRIEESVIVNMGMMMPEEALKELVTKAIDRFFSAQEKFTVTRNHDNGYSSSRVPNVSCTMECSTFEMMVWNAIFPIVKEHLKKFVEDTNSELNKVVEETTNNLNEKLKTLTLQNAVSVIPVMQEYRLLSSVNDTMRNMLASIHTTFCINRLETDTLKDPLTGNTPFR